MERALQLLERLVDNFNMGRALIYTLSCLFFTVPLSMAGNLLVCGPGMSLRETLTRDISFVERHFVGICLFSYVFSFTFTSFAYVLWKRKKGESAPCAKKAEGETRIIDPGGDEGASRVQFIRIKDRTALQWYTSEYYRFFEAAYYVPLGMAVGGVCLLLYLLAYRGLVASGRWAWISAALAILLMDIAFFVLFYRYWCPSVVKAVEEVCERAKDGLYRALLGKAQNEKRPHGEGQAP